MTSIRQSAPSAQAWRLPARLDSPTRASVRWVRQHWLLATVVALVGAGGGIGASLGLQSTSHFVATRTLQRAFVKQDMTEAWGRPSTGLDAFAELQFISSARFAIGIAVTNDASQPVTLTDARAILPRDSVLRQLGTGLVAYNPVCRTPSCPAPAGPLQQGRYGVIRPSPLQVAPGKGAGIQLNFRFLGCPSARHASLQDVSRIQLTYRDRAGAIMRQRVGLTTSTLRIDTPHPCSG
jgi:hypothetical protein